MAQDVNESTVKEVHGAVEKGGSISRVKTFRDANGKPIGKGPQERYTRSERDYKKHPQTANEKAHQSLWSAVCAQAKQELADPEKHAYWQQHYDEYKATAKPSDKYYFTLRGFVIAQLSKTTMNETNM